MTDITTLVDGRVFLEGPRWRTDRLVCSDMHAHEVISVAVDGAVSVVASLPGPPSGLGWLPDGRLLIVSMEDRLLLTHERDGSLATSADLSVVAPHEINDMVVDKRTGIAYVSQFGYDMHGGGTPRPAPLLRADPDGTVSAAAPNLRMANGMAITADGRTLVVAESAGKAITAFRIVDDGSLTDRRIWAELPDHPDGICIDAADGVWIAAPVGDRFVRVVEGGEVTDVIETPGRHGIACALGGPDGRTLFMLTAETLGSADESRRRRSARIEIATVAVPGCESP